MIKDFISMNMLFVYVSGKEIKNAQPFSIAKGSGSLPDPNIYYRTLLFANCGNEHSAAEDQGEHGGQDQA